MPQLFKNDIDLNFLEKLVDIHGPSGEEQAVRDFIINHVQSNSKTWKSKPTLYYGDAFQDALIMVFGKPSTAIFCHMDTIGFTVRYENQLVPIGSPDAKKGYRLTGKDSKGPVVCGMQVDQDGYAFHDFPRPIERGTSLVYQSNFRYHPPFVTSPYMDNRLGVYAALKVAETLENGIIVCSTYEEHGGGSVPFLLRYIMDHFPIRQALIADITWVTEGVHHGDGVVISMRDRNIPRKSFLNKVIEIAVAHSIKFQLEVEGHGSSDGKEVQHAPYAIDWLFIGAPEDHVHTPNEKVHVEDIQSMIDLYRILMKNL